MPVSFKQLTFRDKGNRSLNPITPFPEVRKPRLSWFNYLKINLSIAATFQSRISVNWEIYRGKNGAPIRLFCTYRYL